MPDKKDTPDVQPLLDYIDGHISLTPDEKSGLLGKIKLRNYLKGQFIVQQGDTCQFLSFVLSGCLKTSHIDNNGQEHIIRFAIEGWWIADLGSFISQTPADCNVQCLENTRVVQFSDSNLEQLYLEIPHLERLFRILFQRAFAASEKRVIRNFSLPAKERYLIFREQYPDIEQRVPQYLVASYLGITKEFLSKIRNQLARGQ